MTRLQRVFIDTSELFPFTIMDVLLTLAEDFLFTWTWTDELRCDDFRPGSDLREHGIDRRDVHQRP